MYQYDQYYPQVVFNAVSGVLNEFGRTQPAYQDRENYGPVVEGRYRIDPKKSYAMNNHLGMIRSGRLSWDDTKQVLIWRAGFSSWGFYKTQLRPYPDTKKNIIMFGRNEYSFYIHGGTDLGSVGCIDLTGDNERFHQWFYDYGKGIDIHVKY